MTYLHDYTTARKVLRENVIPKMVAALMPTMDMLKFEYVRVEDTLVVMLPDGILPEGYQMRIVFEPFKNAEWKTLGETMVKDPGF